MPQRPSRYRPIPKRPPPCETTRPNATDRGYTYRWKQARLAFLAANPLCVRCKEKTPSVTTEATVVDHSIPHRGDMTLFWDSSLWIALCTRCHNVKTATEDGAFGRAIVSKTNVRGDAT